MAFTISYLLPRPHIAGAAAKTMKELMHIPALVTVYLLISAVFIVYTGIEILRYNTRLRFIHWLGISLCTVWPALVIMALLSVFAGRMRLSQR